MSCQEFQGFENTNIQANLPSKSARTREAKRKDHQRVSSHLESTDCSSEDEKVYFRPRFTRSQHHPLRKEEDSQSSADILSDNSISKSNRPRQNKDQHQHHQEEKCQSNTDVLSDNAIAQSSSQIYSRDHQQQHQSQNSPEQKRKTYHRVESEKPTAWPQSQEADYQPRVIKTIEVTDKESLSTVGRAAVQRNQRILKKIEVSDLEELEDGDRQVKQRKGRQQWVNEKFIICVRGTEKILILKLKELKTTYLH